MTPDPAVLRECAHIMRRRQPLPPLGDLLPDDAMAVVAAEMRRREWPEVHRGAPDSYGGVKL